MIEVKNLTKAYGNFVAVKDVSFKAENGSILGFLGEIPDIQSQALAGALGLAPSIRADRLLTSAAVLGLLAAAAEKQPILCVVDDAQWLDHASALTLAFVARRLQADPVALVFAAREPGVELEHLRRLEVRGLRMSGAYYK